jgi:hypothetical protein
VFGSHFFHFDSEVRALTWATPAAQISTVARLGEVVGNWLGDEPLRWHIRKLERSVRPDGISFASRYADPLEPFLAAGGI